MKIVRLIFAAFLVQLRVATSYENFTRGSGGFRVAFDTNTEGSYEDHKASEVKVLSELVGKEIEHLVRDGNKGQNADASNTHGNSNENSSQVAHAAAENRGLDMNKNPPSETEHLKDEMPTAVYFNTDVGIAPANTSLPPSPDPMDDKISVTKVRPEEHMGLIWFGIIFFLVFAAYAFLVCVKICLDGWRLPCCRPRRDQVVPENVGLMRMN